MNIAIEYMLRQGRVERLLSLPCSLFLESAEKKRKKDVLNGKLVVTLMPRYGSDSIVIRQFQVGKTTSSDMLPPYEESVIGMDEVFRHPKVIVPGHKLLEFQVQPFDCEQRQVNDLPLAAIQERQYKDTLQFFFSPKIMGRVREDWLWNCFEAIYVTNDIRNHPDMRHYYHYAKPAVQQDFVRKQNKAINKVWELWKKTLLYNSDPASELVFARYYDSEFLKYVPPPEPEQMDEEAIAALMAAAGIAPPKKKKKRRQQVMFFPAPQELAQMEHELNQMINRSRRKRKVNPE